MAAITCTLPFAPGNFIGCLLSRPDVTEAWEEGTEHVFLERVADGALPIEGFRYYLIQDYLRLIQLAPANMLAGYRTKNFEDIVLSAEITLRISHEMSHHLEYCSEFS